MIKKFSEGRIERVADEELMGSEELE